MTAADARTERLVANRRAAALKKQVSTLAVLEEMISRGARVSFVDVQRKARVSTWFVYNNPTVRLAIDAAIKDQQDHGIAAPSMSLDDRTTAGLRVELANAQAEIRDLRTERDRLRHHLQRSLGNQLDAMSKHELVEQLRAAEQDNARLRAELRSTAAELASTSQERDEASANCDGAQLALRQMMRAVPREGRPDV